MPRSSHHFHYHFHTFGGGDSIGAIVLAGGVAVALLIGFLIDAANKSGPASPSLRSITPDQSAVVPVGALPACALITGEGRWHVAMRRPDGAMISEQTVSGTAVLAVQLATTALARVGAATVAIDRNETNHFGVRRPYPPGRPVTYTGQELGSVLISRIAD